MPMMVEAITGVGLAGLAAAAAASESDEKYKLRKYLRRFFSLSTSSYKIIHVEMNINDVRELFLPSLFPFLYFSCSFRALAK